MGRFEHSWLGDLRTKIDTSYQQLRIARRLNMGPGTVQAEA
jgi:hypothetical protein